LNKKIKNNTLLFKLSSSGEFSNIEINNEITNFIIDMQEVDIDQIEVIKKKLIKFDRSVYLKNGSFVIVCRHSFDKELNIVPTIQEAYDFIEMEEIERQLNDY
tara:strand:+ start:17154 stop:17462 length:309 start_codon:yes stop_codon:yes gene_type:complete